MKLVSMAGGVYPTATTLGDGGWLVKPGALVSNWTITSTTNAAGFLLPLDDILKPGSTITSAALKFNPGNIGTDPTHKPAMAIVRMPRYSNDYITGSVSLRSAGDILEYTGTYEAGTLATLTYGCNQNNAVDLANYSYSALVFDEHGTNASPGTTYFDVALSLSY